MKNILWFWNLIHYYLYIWQKTAYRVLDYIILCFWLNKIPVVKNFYARHGIPDLNKFVDKVVFDNRRFGFNIILAGAHAGGLLVLIEFGLFMIAQTFLGDTLLRYISTSSIYRYSFAIFFGLIVTGLFDYFTLFRKNKYLKYFREFDKMPRSKRLKYGWLCFLTVLMILLFFVGSLVLYCKYGKFYTT